MRHAQVCLGALIWYQKWAGPENQKMLRLWVWEHTPENLFTLQKPSSKSGRYWVLAGTYCNTPVRKVSPHPPQSRQCFFWPGNHQRDCGTLSCPLLGSISGQHTVFISWPAITNDPRPGGLTQQEQLWRPEVWNPAGRASTPRSRHRPAFSQLLRLLATWFQSLPVSCVSVLTPVSLLQKHLGWHLDPTGVSLSENP